jgi:hypothetical protein
MVVKKDIHIYGHSLVLSALCFTMIFTFVSQVFQSQIQNRITLFESFNAGREFQAPFPLRETRVYPATVRENPQHRVLSKSEDKRRKYVQKLNLPLQVQ